MIGRDKCLFLECSWFNWSWKRFYSAKKLFFQEERIVLFVTWNCFWDYNIITLKKHIQEKHKEICFSLYFSHFANTSIGKGCERMNSNWQNFGRFLGFRLYVYEVKSILRNYALIWFFVFVDFLHNQSADDVDWFYFYVRKQQKVKTNIRISFLYMNDSAEIRQTTQISTK